MSLVSLQDAGLDTTVPDSPWFCGGNLSSSSSSSSLALTLLPSGQNTPRFSSDFVEQTSFVIEAKSLQKNSRCSSQESFCQKKQNPNQQRSEHLDDEFQKHTNLYSGSNRQFHRYIYNDSYFGMQQPSLQTPPKLRTAEEQYVQLPVGSENFPTSQLPNQKMNSYHLLSNKKKLKKPLPSIAFAATLSKPTLEIPFAQSVKEKKTIQLQTFFPLSRIVNRITRQTERSIQEAARDSQKDFHPNNVTNLLDFNASRIRKAKSLCQDPSLTSPDSDTYQSPSSKRKIFSINSNFKITASSSKSIWQQMQTPSSAVHQQSNRSLGRVILPPSYPVSRSEQVVVVTRGRSFTDQHIKPVKVPVHIKSEKNSAASQRPTSVGVNPTVRSYLLQTKMESLRRGQEISTQPSISQKSEQGETSPAEVFSCLNRKKLLRRAHSMAGGEQFQYDSFNSPVNIQCDATSSPQYPVANKGSPKTEVKFKRRLLQFGQRISRVNSSCADPMSILESSPLASRSSPQELIPKFNNTVKEPLSNLLTKISWSKSKNIPACSASNGSCSGVGIKSKPIKLSENVLQSQLNENSWQDTSSIQSVASKKTTRKSPVRSSSDAESLFGVLPLHPHNKQVQFQHQQQMLSYNFERKQKIAMSTDLQLNPRLSYESAQQSLQIISPSLVEVRRSTTH